MQNGDKAVDAVDVEATWQCLAARVGSQLIDVRTRAEWAYVGIPDLGPLGRRAVLVEWQTFPDQTIDPRFAAEGYRACHNVAGGFEGPLDDERHRGSVGGWKAAGLPWLQG